MRCLSGSTQGFLAISKGHVFEVEMDIERLPAPRFHS